MLALSEKKNVRFKGIRFKLRDTAKCAALPETFSGGDNPDMYMVDRWAPASRNDALMTNSLPERNYEWISTNHSQVCYGLERWGRIDEDYSEWFCLIVIRPVLLPPVDAAIICSQSQGRMPQGSRE